MGAAGFSYVEVTLALTDVKLKNAKKQARFEQEFRQDVAAALGVDQVRGLRRHCHQMSTASRHRIGGARHRPGAARCPPPPVAFSAATARC